MTFLGASLNHSSHLQDFKRYSTTVAQGHNGKRESTRILCLCVRYDNGGESHFDGVERPIARRELVRHRLFAQPVVRHGLQRHRRLAFRRGESSRAGRHRLAPPCEAESPPPSLLAPLLRTSLVLALLRDRNLTRTSLWLHELSSPLHNVTLN